MQTQHQVSLCLIQFDRLNEVLVDKSHRFVKPCFFSTQSADTSRRLIQREIYIGHDKDKYDGIKRTSAI